MMYFSLFLFSLFIALISECAQFRAQSTANPNTETDQHSTSSPLLTGSTSGVCCSSSLCNTGYFAAVVASWPIPSDLASFYSISGTVSASYAPSPAMASADVAIVDATGNRIWTGKLGAGSSSSVRSNTFDLSQVAFTAQQLAGASVQAYTNNMYPGWCFSDAQASLQIKYSNGLPGASDPASKNITGSTIGAIVGGLISLLLVVGVVTGLIYRCRQQKLEGHLHAHAAYTDASAPVAQAYPVQVEGESSYYQPPSYEATTAIAPVPLVYSVGVIPAYSVPFHAPNNQSQTTALQPV